MFTISKRTDAVCGLAAAFDSHNETWKTVREEAHRANGWFTVTYIDLAVQHIVNRFLDRALLEAWLLQYPDLSRKFPEHQSLTVGIVMAGNIPLVGFHDFLAAFLAGFKVRMKLSSKDTVLWNYIYGYLSDQYPEFRDTVTIVPMLKDCDAYIATGSNNTSRYFEQYFGRYPHIIRKNRTSVAVLTGQETDAELQALESSINTYFGLGCRNISKIYVPVGYDFERFIAKTKHHIWQRDHNKYKNNYDYQLAMYILNKVQYMSNEATLFVENREIYAPVSVVHYEYYDRQETIYPDLNRSEVLQCIETAATNLPVLQAHTTVPVIPLGSSQSPGLTDYADNVDTMAFLSAL